MIHFHRINTEDLPYRAFLNIADAHCHVLTNSRRLLQTLGRWRCTARLAPDLQLNVFVDDELRPADGRPVFRGMDHVVFASFGSNLFGFDLHRKRVTAVVCPETGSDERFWSHVLLPIALGVMGPLLGVVPMHCACVEWKGKGVLIAGLSGAGKSTLSAAMAEYGFGFISDDWTYISGRGAQLSAYGLSAPLKLLPDTEQFFAALRKHRPTPSMNGEDAFQVDPSEFAPNPKRMTTPATLLLLQRFHGEGTVFHSLDAGTVSEFFERSSERLPEFFTGAKALRSQIINRVSGLDCWRFEYSGSPQEGARSVHCFLENQQPWTRY